MDSIVSALTEANDRHSYLVRLIKPNLIASHDWHVQPICQRSLRVIRLSGTLGIEVRTCVRLSSNLVRFADFAAYTAGLSFLARTF